MTEGKKTALVLGGTDPHVALVQNLKKRGYYTILIDYLDQPPAKAVADLHIKESTLDKEKVLEIAFNLSVNLVISTSIDQANITACYVADKLGLTVPYNYETSLVVTNKILMKKGMWEGGIPTSKYVQVKNTATVPSINLEFPVVVKPADTTGSKGVRKVDNISDLNIYLREALSLSRTGEAVIEEFAEGKEVQCDFFVSDSKAHLVMTREKRKSGVEGDFVLQSVGSIVPAGMSAEMIRKIEKIGQQIADTFNLNNTSLFLQAIVEKGKVSVIEFAPRIGGGLSYSMIKIITGFDILDATVDSFLGLKREISIKQSDYCYATTIIYASPGIFETVVGFSDLLTKGTMEKFYFFKTKGMQIGPHMTSSDRIGAFLTKGKDLEELSKKVSDAVDKLEVLNSEGKGIMRKDILESAKIYKN